MKNTSLAVTSSGHDLEISSKKNLLERLHEAYVSLWCFCSWTSTLVAIAFYGFAWLFRMLGHEVLGKVIGYAVGVLGVIAVLLMKDAYNRKKRKERRELEREYRALGLLGDD